MAIKKLIEVWDGKNLLKNNIKFLKRTDVFRTELKTEPEPKTEP